MGSAFWAGVVVIVAAFGLEVIRLWLNQRNQKEI